MLITYFKNPATLARCRSGLVGHLSKLILLKKTDFVILLESESLILSHLRNTIFRKSGFFSRINFDK